MANTNVTVPSQPLTIENSLDARAQDLIKKHALLAVGAGLIPIPGVDIGAVTAIQTRMVAKLAALYNIPFYENRVKIVLTSLAGSTLSRLIASLAHRSLNTFSSFGGAALQLTNSALTGFATVATGDVYRIHFNNGGTIEDLDVTDFIDYLQKEISEGNISLNMFSNARSGFKYLF